MIPTNTIFDPSVNVLLQYMRSTQRKEKRPTLVGMFSSSEVLLRKKMEYIMHQGAETGETILGFGSVMDEQTLRHILKDPRAKQSTGILLNCGSPYTSQGKEYYDVTRLPTTFKIPIDLSVRVDPIGQYGTPNNYIYTTILVGK